MVFIFILQSIIDSGYEIIANFVL